MAHLHDVVLRHRDSLPRDVSRGYLMASCLHLNLRTQWRRTYSRGTSVGIVTDYRLNVQGIGVRSRCPDRLLDPSSFPYNGY
jgi:hypothetical protein